MRLVVVGGRTPWISRVHVGMGRSEIRVVEWEGNGSWESSWGELSKRDTVVIMTLLLLLLVLSLS